ncbi:MAG: hypothetical protein HOP23_00480 [Methylococcaceae bacterium]|nr:hypothetical protein [Methylococcaceae bacterium]
MINSRTEYESAFAEDKAKVALELALDTRKFEISLYWQRTAYFWALIAAAFAGYFAVLSAEHIEHKSFNAFTLDCIGLVFSLAWFRVNRGSKFWQENWERHVDLLENAVCGPLYKTVLQGKPSGRGFAGGAPVSVSRVNQWVAVFTVLIWLILAAVQLPSFNASSTIDWLYMVVATITVVAGLILFLCTTSNLAENMDSPVINREASLN